jgi:hypothetical protein
MNSKFSPVFCSKALASTVPVKIIRHFFGKKPFDKWTAVNDLHSDQSVRHNVDHLKHRGRWSIKYKIRQFIIRVGSCLRGCLYGPAYQDSIKCEVFWAIEISLTSWSNKISCYKLYEIPCFRQKKEMLLNAINRLLPLHNFYYVPNFV